MQQQIKLIACESANIDEIVFSKNILIRKKYKRADGWTLKDFEEVKIGFEKGSRIKEIAIKLGRSETAVNKFLTRSGIRPKLKTYIISQKKKNNIMCQSIIRKKTKKEKYFEKYTFVFDEVVEYIKSKGYCVEKNYCKNIFYEESQYLVNGRPTSALKFLLLANRLKIEERANIFMLPEIMW